MTSFDELSDAEFEAKMEQIICARAAIVKHSNNRRRVAASIPCPICKIGNLGYEVHHNGHIWARCNTEKCVNWIE